MQWACLIQVVARAKQNDLQISRHVKCNNPVHLELYPFSDASVKALAPCSFICRVEMSGRIADCLLCAKCEVETLKRITVT